MIEERGRTPTGEELIEERGRRPAGGELQPQPQEQPPPRSFEEAEERSQEEPQRSRRERLADRAVFAQSSGSHAGLIGSSASPSDRGLQRGRPALRHWGRPRWADSLDGRRGGEQRARRRREGLEERDGQPAEERAYGRAEERAYGCCGSLHKSSAGATRASPPATRRIRSSASPQGLRDVCLASFAAWDRFPLF